MRRLLLLTATLGVVALSGCTRSASETVATTPTSKLDTLVVADPDFTFATRRKVQLQLQPTAANVAVPVIVNDARGRRLFKGAVRQPVALDLKVAKGSDNTLTVVTGRGDDAKTQTVRLEGDRGVAQF